MTPQGYLLILFIIAVCIEFGGFLAKRFIEIADKKEKQREFERFSAELLRQHLKQEPERKPPPDDAVPIGNCDTGKY